VLVIAAALALVGCGGSHHAGGRATLSIMGFGTGDDIARARVAIAKRAIAPARLDNPNGAFSMQQFLTGVAGGEAPDLIYVDRQQIGTLAARGAISSLDSCISSEHIDMSQYRPPAVHEVTYRGSVYGIPEFYDNRTIIINDPVAAQAGVPVGAISTSDWSRLRGAAKKMAKLVGRKVARIGFDPKLPEFFPLWAKANGADLLSADGRHAHLDDPRAVEALTYAAGLIHEQGGWNAFKAFRDSWDFFGSKNEFVRKQLGAFPMEDWYYNVLASNSPDVQISARPFTDRSGRPIDWETGNAWAIPADAQHKDVACKWAKTMTAVTTWVKAATVRASAAKKQHQPFTGLYTANKAADDQIFSKLYRPINRRFDAAVKMVLDVQQHAFAVPASPASAAFQTAWQSAVNRVLVGRQSPRAALEQAQREAQDAIDTARQSQ